VAFLKQANAMVVHPRVTGRAWGGIRKAASTGSTRDLTAQAHQILGEALDPDKYLITHCTIVASVDTDQVPNAKLGNVRVGSTTINRKYDDYHIVPASSQFVNNNGDSWSREVLRMAYPTFIGAQNFQEHVQIEEQSKGRIIDAVARDIGDSLYVDILVATNRKHAKLVQDIESGKLSTLSMGCLTDFTVCSKCGHVAVDETQLCEHIRYAKLNTFLDDAGQKRVIAELCGHHTYDDNPDAPGGVRFIEASWVAVPAFQGAVMRNILSPREVPQDEMRKILASPAPGWSETAISKAAHLTVPSWGVGRTAFDFGDDEGGEGGDESGDAPADDGPKAPFQDLEDTLYDTLKARVRERIESEIAQRNTEDKAEPADAMGPNDNVIKEAGRYRSSLDTLVRVASSPAALVYGVSRINESYGMKAPRALYEVAYNVGSPTRYASADQYLSACRKVAGRELKPAELRVVVRVGTLLSRWEGINNPNPTC